MVLLHQFLQIVSTNSMPHVAKFYNVVMEIIPISEFLCAHAPVLFSGFTGMTGLSKPGASVEIVGSTGVPGGSTVSPGVGAGTGVSVAGLGIFSGFVVLRFGMTGLSNPGASVEIVGGSAVSEVGIIGLEGCSGMGSFDAAGTFMDGQSLSEGRVLNSPYIMLMHSHTSIKSCVWWIFNDNQIPQWVSPTPPRWASPLVRVT